MKLWERNLSCLSSDEHDRKIGSPSEISNIIINFMIEEIYPRLLSLKNELNTSGFVGTIFPESIDKITTVNQIIGLSINNNSNIEYSLKFYQENNLDLGVKGVVKNGMYILATIALDRKPDSPTLLLEKYIVEFKDRSFKYK